MKKLSIIVFISVQIAFAQKQDYIQLSTSFIESVKKQDNKEDDLIKIFANADEKELLQQLNNDDRKKTFLINLYNGYTHNSLRKNPKQFADRNKFFKSEQFVLAGNKISLDNIEHDFLRKSSVKLSLGKLSKIFPGKLELKYRVDKIDYRIHFALNCGAKSCPAVDVYKLETIEKQLESNKIAYLKKDTKFDKAKNEVYVTSLMSWFRGDFGNLDGVEKIIKNLKIIPADSDPTLKFNDYDWTLDLNNFK